MNLDKTQVSEWCRYTELLEELRAVLGKAVDEYNAVIAGAFVPVETAAEALNEAIREANSFVEEVASSFREEFSCKSEKWQESDQGMGADSFVYEWEEVFIDEISIEAPEEIDISDSMTHEGLEGLPESSE